MRKFIPTLNNVVGAKKYRKNLNYASDVADEQVVKTSDEKNVLHEIS